MELTLLVSTGEQKVAVADVISSEISSRYKKTCNIYDFIFVLQSAINVTFKKVHIHMQLNTTDNSYQVHHNKDKQVCHTTCQYTMTMPTQFHTRTAGTYLPPH
jgi:hypothetical protein